MKASAKQEVVPLRIHRITLYECASSHRSHVNCPAFLYGESLAYEMHCSCSCHGIRTDHPHFDRSGRPFVFVDESVDTGNRCATCKEPMPVEVVDDAVFVGDSKRTESVALKNCPACRAAFLKEMQGGRP